MMRLQAAGCMRKNDDMMINDGMTNDMVVMMTIDDMTHDTVTDEDDN